MAQNAQRLQCNAMQMWKIERNYTAACAVRILNGNECMCVVCMCLYVQVRWLRKVCAFFMFKVAISSRMLDK